MQFSGIECHYVFLVLILMANFFTTCLGFLLTNSSGSKSGHLPGCFLPCACYYHEYIDLHIICIPLYCDNEGDEADAYSALHDE